MLWLLICAVLSAAMISVVYRLSPAAKMKARVRQALSPFEQLDADIRGLELGLTNEAQSLTRLYTETVYASRLRAIALDDLKRYATGMRLQALKDAGIRTVADLQGWNEYRVSQVRGVGPKSANAIVRSVATVIRLTKTIPICHPSPPFSEDSERQLMQALYRQRWYAAHLSTEARDFSSIVSAHESTRDEILAKTTFGRWFWKFGANATIHLSLEEGRELLRALEEPGLQAKKNALAQSLAECRSICTRQIAVELIIRDFAEARAY